MEALNFYNPLVADQLRSRRKTVTIRLGDKSAKYRKGLCLKVLVGQRFGPRTHVFDAVVDKVEVKRLGDVSPRELQHDNPELRTLDEFVVFLGQLYNRDVSDEDTVTVVHFSEIRPSLARLIRRSAVARRPTAGRPLTRRRTPLRPRRRTRAPRRAPLAPAAANASAASPAHAGASAITTWRSGLRRIGRPKNSASRSASPQPEQVICMSDVMPSPQAGQAAITGCPQSGQLSGSSTGTPARKRRPQPQPAQNAARFPSSSLRASIARSIRRALARGRGARPRNRHCIGRIARLRCGHGGREQALAQ